jgi:hypothetical protein
VKAPPRATLNQRWATRPAGHRESTVGEVLRETLSVCASGLKWFVYPRGTYPPEVAQLRQPGVMDRCKALITWCVLSIVFLRTLDSLETYFTMRARQRKGGGRADRK